jgi:acyl-CoA synthetase (AMP-forming)/AMP-acid ligase II
VVVNFWSLTAECCLIVFCFPRLLLIACALSALPPLTSPLHLTCNAGVSQAVAAVAAAPDGSKRLVGYVTPGGVDIGALLAHCRSQLVPAMVPSAIVALDTFPVMPNGKVSRLFVVAVLLPLRLWR